MIALLSRVALSILLLWIVWSNSHWSVALSITLLMVANALAAIDRRQE